MVYPVILKLCTLEDPHISFNFASHSQLEISIIQELQEKISYFSHKAPPIGNMINPVTLILCTLVDLHIGYNFASHSHLEISIVQELQEKIAYFSRKAPPMGNMVNHVTLKLRWVVDIPIGYNFASHSHVEISIVQELLKKIEYFSHKAPPIGNMVNPVTLKLCTLVDRHIGYKFASHSHIEISIVQELQEKIAYFSHKAPPIGNMVNPVTFKLCILEDLHLCYNFAFQSHHQISTV